MKPTPEAVEEALKIIRSALEEYRDHTDYHGDDDEIGNRACCGVLSFKPHEDSCCAVAGLQSLERLASRVRELESQAPREWTAENIGEAPEGTYYTGSIPNGETRWWGARDVISKSYIPMRISSWGYRYPGIPLVFYGPITQPPQPRYRALMRKEK